MDFSYMSGFKFQAFDNSRLKRSPQTSTPDLTSADVEFVQTQTSK